MNFIRHSVFLFMISAALPSGNAAPRIAIAGISHETNSFNLTKATLADFEAEDALSGNRDLWLETNAKTNQNAAGMIAGAEKYGLELYPIHFFNAVPRGPIDTRGFNTMVGRVIEGLKQEPGYDGVLLLLHGAMVADGFPSGDAEIVQRVRQAMGPGFPIAVTHDFHANVDPAIVANANIVITGKECPHLDTKERGFQTAAILARMIKGEVKPVQAIVKPPMMLNLIHHDTYRLPLKPIVDASKEAEKKPGVLAVSIPGGYQYGDAPAMGPSVIVITDNDPALAKSEAERLAAMLWALRDNLKFDLPEPAKAVSMAMASKSFPVTLLDTGDNLGGGSAGDSTFILAELLRQKAEGWVVALFDPEAVQKALSAGVGKPFAFRVGGKTDRMHGEPILIRGTVKSLSDGKFIETEVRHGGSRYWDMGLTAVIEAEGSTRDLSNIVILNTKRTIPLSIHQLVSVGVYPERQKILVAKGTIA
ncbi:MAG TPA: M81 family metallopeptidase, partial [Terriglobia bacterium]|nr:M81 family metallopeptidase [Terriglobia bacterium]